MPRPRAVMRKIREVLRLTLGEQLSQRRVKQITGVAEATQYDYVEKGRRSTRSQPAPTLRSGGSTTWIGRGPGREWGRT
jgi:transposase